MALLHDGDVTKTQKNWMNRAVSTVNTISARCSGIQNLHRK